MVLAWQVGRPAGVTRAPTRAALLLLLAATTCGPEEAEQDVNGRGAWMLTVESMWQVENPSHRLVATKLDEGVTVDILDIASYPCLGPTSNVARIGSWVSGGDGPRILRLTASGFNLEPDLLPPELYGGRGCPLVWELDRAVLMATTEAPDTETPDQDRGVFLTSVGPSGSAIAMRLDDGQEPVVLARRVSSHSDLLLYATQGTARSSVYQVAIDQNPPTPVLVDQMAGLVHLTASDRWLVYASPEEPFVLRAADLARPQTPSVEFELPESTVYDLRFATWHGDDRLVFRTDDEDSSRVFLFSAETGGPQVTAVTPGELRPISAAFVQYTRDHLIFSFQIVSGNPRTKGIARVDGREPATEPAVIFELEANNPYAKIEWFRGNPLSNTSLVGWTDAEARTHIAEVDTTTGEVFSLEEHTRDCETTSIQISWLGTEGRTLGIVCTIDGRQRGFMADRQSPLDRLWLDDFNNDSDSDSDSDTTTTSSSRCALLGATA